MGIVGRYSRLALWGSIVGQYSGTVMTVGIVGIVGNIVGQYCRGDIAGQYCVAVY